MSFFQLETPKLAADGKNNKFFEPFWKGMRLWLHRLHCKDKVRQIGVECYLLYSCGLSQALVSVIWKGEMNVRRLCNPFSYPIARDVATGFLCYYSKAGKHSFVSLSIAKTFLVILAQWWTVVKINAGRCLQHYKRQNTQVITWRSISFNQQFFHTRPRSSDSETKNNLKDDAKCAFCCSNIFMVVKAFPS